MRVYTQMGELQPGERINRAEVTLEKLLEKTQTAMKPFKLEFPYVDWYTCYEVGQRVCETFSRYNHHVFIAGDACHTHSPKAGQGMNVSPGQEASTMQSEICAKDQHDGHLESWLEACHGYTRTSETRSSRNL